MPRVAPERRKKLLDIHGWTAVSLGLLLYLVVVTGMVAVLADEIANWSSPLSTRPVATVPAGIDSTMRSMAAEVPERFHEDVHVFAQAGGRLRTFFHTHDTHPDSGKPEEVGVEFDLDPASFEILDRREGWGDDIESRNRPNALAHFLTELHIRLHIPDPYGLWFTALAGFALSIALVTGFFMQARPLRDLLTWRRRAEATVAARDRHVVTGSWTLPFVLLLAITGSYLSFVFSIGFPAMAAVAYEGDKFAMFDTIFGVPAAKDPRPAEPADIDAMISDVVMRSGSEPNFVLIRRWGRADSVVTLFTPPAEGSLRNRSYVYGGADGSFRFEKPLFGTSESVAGSLASVIDPLHFGSFAGLLSKIVWVSLGFMAAHTAIAGLLYWCRRRRNEAIGRVATRVVHWLGYGLPMALAATAYGYFPARAAGIVETSGYIALAFFVAVTLATVLSVLVTSAMSCKHLLQGMTGALLLGLPWMRWLCGGPDWTTALEVDAAVVVAMDVVFMIAGLVFLVPALQRQWSIAYGNVNGRGAAQAARSE